MCYEIEVLGLLANSEHKKLHSLLATILTDQFQGLASYGTRAILRKNLNQATFSNQEAGLESRGDAFVLKTVWFPPVPRINSSAPL